MKNLLSFVILISFNGFSQEVFPEQFGAYGDGIHDDLSALDSAAKYLYNTGGVINLRGKYYRITNTWQIGERFVSEQDAYNPTPTSAPSFNLDAYVRTLKKKPIKVVSDGTGGIFGDFSSTTPKAIIYYALNGDTRAWPSGENYSAELNGFGIYGKNGFANGKPILKGSWADYVPNNFNQIGVVSLFTMQMKINSVTFYDLKEGILMNNSYFSNISNCYFKFNKKGVYHVQSHGSVLNNVIAYYCDKAYLIKSGQVIMTNINAEHCIEGLHITQGSNTVNGAYLEANNITQGEGQLIIGEETGALIEGVTINSLTTAPSNGDGSIATGVKLKRTAKMVIINGGNITGYSRDTTLSVLLLAGVGGTNPSWAYQRGQSISASSVTASTLSATSTSTGTLTATGNISGYTISATGDLNVTGQTKQSVICCATTGAIKSKIVNGLIGSTDYIIKLGKYSVADASKINGRLNILGNSVYTSGGWIDIAYSNLATGYAYSIYDSRTGAMNLTVSVIKYTEGGVVWAGIRFKTTATTAWMPYYFYFDGYISDNPYLLTTVDAANVTAITPLISQ